MGRHYVPPTRDEGFALEAAAWAVANASSAIAALTTPRAGQEGYDDARDDAIASLRESARRMDQAAKKLATLAAREARAESPRRAWGWQADDPRRRC